MSVRVETGLSTRLDSSTSLKSSQQSTQVPTVGQQVQQTLFGRPRPPVLDPAQFPQLAETLRLLNRFRKKLAVLAGDAEDDYRLVLADDTIAMIDEEGTIYVGAGFISAHQQNPEVLVGVLAHEIGHRPKRWKQRKYRARRELSKAQRDAICRFEETMADLFAGKGLAELEMDCEPLAQFLLRVQKGPHPEYFPAEVRAKVIRDAHQSRAYRAEQRRKLFPGQHRATAPRRYLGEF